MYYENAGALARPPAMCPPCHYSKQKVLLTVMSHGSPMRVLTNRQTHRRTDTQTHRTDFIPSTAEAGGKTQVKWILLWLCKG